MVNMGNRGSEFTPRYSTNRRENKDETIISVIKRLFGEHVTSRSVKTQNRELSFRGGIAYNNMHRLTNLVIIVMVSTWPKFSAAYNN
jgi:hypothetical protein